MSKLFDDGSSQYMATLFAAISEPFTLAAWVYSDAAVDQTIVSVGDADGPDFHGIILWNDGEVRAHSWDGVAQGIATATDTWSVNTWHHVTAIYYASNSRSAFIDGGNKGNSSDNVNVTDIDRAAIGVSADSTPIHYASGRIAEVPIWDVALSDLEIWQLGMGRPPWEIQRAHLVGLWLPFGDRTDRDFSGRGYHMTAYNGPTFSGFDPPKIVRAWRGNPQYIGRRVTGREQPGGVRARLWGMSPAGPDLSISVVATDPDHLVKGLKVVG